MSPDAIPAIVLPVSTWNSVLLSIYSLETLQLSGVLCQLPLTYLLWTYFESVLTNIVLGARCQDWCSWAAGDNGHKLSTITWTHRYLRWQRDIDSCSIWRCVAVIKYGRDNCTLRHDHRHEFSNDVCSTACNNYSCSHWPEKVMSCLMFYDANWVTFVIAL